MTGKIFINYRRGEDSGFVQAILSRLENAFASDRIFIDVDSMEPGTDFVRVLGEQVAQCDLFLAVIGKRWVEARDVSGARRLDSTADFVRIEIASALEQGKRVIPILLDDAQMPKPDQLPANVKELSSRSAFRLTHDRFKAEAASLVVALRKIMEDVQIERENAASEARRSTKTSASEKHATKKPTSTLKLIVLYAFLMMSAGLILVGWDIWQKSDSSHADNTQGTPPISHANSEPAKPAAPHSKLTNQQLDLIESTADRICGTIGANANATSTETVRTELNGLATKLGPIGGQGSATTTTTTYQGFEREVLPELRKNEADCKYQVFLKLREKLTAN